MCLCVCACACMCGVQAVRCKRKHQAWILEELSRSRREMAYHSGTHMHIHIHTRNRICTCTCVSTCVSSCKHMYITSHLSSSYLPSSFPSYHTAHCTTHYNHTLRPTTHHTVLSYSWFRRARVQGAVRPYRGPHHTANSFIGQSS